MKTLILSIALVIVSCCSSDYGKWSFEDYEKQTITNAGFNNDYPNSNWYERWHYSSDGRCLHTTIMRWTLDNGSHEWRMIHAVDGIFAGTVDHAFIAKDIVQMYSESVKLFTDKRYEELGTIHRNYPQ